MYLCIAWHSRPPLPSCSPSQRFFPDFFPSCYTEKRQTLWRLYSEIERKSEDELLGSVPDEVTPVAVNAVASFFETLFKQLRVKLSTEDS